MEDMYSEYVAMYRKSYQSSEEYAMRFKIFSENIRLIAEHNEQDSSYEMGVNQFTDWTNLEYRRMLGYVRPENVETAEMAPEDGPYFDSIDWVKKGAVNAVQNQGQCGSCWAFGTIGTVEGAHFVSTGKLLKYSEQELVDCCHDQCAGCNGGFQNNAMTWLSKNPICLESEYKYTARDGTCRKQSCSTQGIVIKGYNTVPTTADGLRRALSVMPVSVTVDAGSSAFQHYKSGILADASCRTNLNHAVLGVGYGTENGKNYFTIKNSWGASWGDHGFIRISDGGPAGKGYCGVLMDNSYPKV